jgi:replicative DNA helicase
MDIEVAVLFHAAVDGSVVERLETAGFDPASLDDPKHRKAYKFIKQHFDDHKVPAGVGAVLTICGLDLDGFGLESSFVIHELLKRTMYRRISALLDQSGDQLRMNNPDAALEMIKDFAAVEVGVSTGAAPTSIFSLGDSVKEAYLKVKAGYTGVPLPWPTMTDLTMGLWPATATYFVARPGVGKTQVATLIARDTWRSGKRVLIISPEMSKSEIAERFFVVQAGVSAGDIVRGRLSSFAEDKLFGTIKDLEGNDGVYVIDSTDDLTPNGMDIAIAAVKPDLVAVDSIYMLRFKGDKMERTMRAVDWIRQAAKRHNVPFVAFHQLSRQATKDKKQGGGYDTSAIALSDQLLWDAHAVFIMEQDTDMKADRRLKFHVGKLRRGSHDGEPIEVHWDFDGMRFEEIAKDGDDKDFKDGDYDTKGYGVPF